MRVLHLMDSAGVFGAEVMLLSLAQAQRANAVDVLLGSIQTPKVFDQGEDALAKLARELQIPVIDIVMPERSVLRGRAILREAIIAAKPDLIHAHGYKANILLATLKNSAPTPPVITTVHGWTAPSRPGAMLLYEKLDQWALKTMDKVVVVAEAQLLHPAIQALPAGRVACIENGIDLNWRSSLPVADDQARLMRSLNEFTQDAEVIVAIGRLAPEKGYDCLVSAFAAIAEQRPQARLIIAGEGRLRAELEAQVAALQMTDRVWLPGYIERVEQLFATACCLAQPSLTEGLPVTVLEAMAYGVPVIATRVGGLPDLLENGAAGWLVPPGDAAALATALHNVLGGQEDTALRTARAKDVFVQGHSAARMADRYQSIYNSAVGK